MDLASFLATALPTVLILGWSALLAALWLWLVFERRARKLERHGSLVAKDRGRLESQLLPLLPALACGPLVVGCGFRLFGVDVLFPVMMLSDVWTLAKAAFLPALVLAAASGLFGQLARIVELELGSWQDSAFLRGVRARGSSPRKALRRLVMVQAATRAGAAALPWLFGELIIVEAVFNAPGLGLAAWHAAKLRDAAAMALPMGALAGLYGLSWAISAAAHHWLGRRLASYA